MSDTPARPEAPAAAGPSKLGGLPEIDLREFGGKKDGVRQALDRRLFMQLLAFEAAAGADADAIARRLHETLHAAGQPHVLYADANAPSGLGLLTWSEDPAQFVGSVRTALRAQGKELRQRHEFTMLGRTYATGHEPDLEHVLLGRPIEYVNKAEWNWHIWYPLRRTGAFSQLSPEEQGGILREHAQIGFAYGQRDFARDVRLACHGLDGQDNEFVIGLVGETLHPLSHLVQTMRKTKQTSEFIAQMGPFFVGRVLHRGGF